MTDDHLLYEKIDQYLKGTLSESENHAFELQLSKDYSLRSLVDTQKIANQVIITKQLIALQTKILSDLSAKKRWNNYRNLLGISVALIGIGTIVYFTSQTKKPISKPSITAIDATASITTQKNAVTLAPTTITVTPKKPSTLVVSVIKPMEVASNSMITESEKSNESVIQPSTSIEKKSESIGTIPTFEKKIDCSKLSAEYALSASPACLEDQDGKITINTNKIEGGAAPFDFALNRKASFSNAYEFPYLNPGTYTIYVRDANQCIAQTEIEVKEKNCKKSNTFAFTPEFEKWKIPVQQNKQGSIKIFNKSGNLVFTSEVSFDKENLWEGTSSNGMLLESGYYTYRLKYSDGEEEFGTVSIMQP